MSDETPGMTSRFDGMLGKVILLAYCCMLAGMVSVPLVLLAGLSPALVAILAATGVTIAFTSLTRT
ncbi:hypothetical protein [Massilia sp. TN1-12]|uniref:hypothetical protein n=1 Tax=Massilia paldalensis TaxID=3377675 RepID=UPI00384B96A0